MERVNFNYSLKNKPLPSKDNTGRMEELKPESFIKIMRWKAFFCERVLKMITSKILTLVLKTAKTPPKNEHFHAFENDLYNMIQKIELHVINSFLNADT